MGCLFTNFTSTFIVFWKNFNMDFFHSDWYSISNCMYLISIKNFQYLLTRILETVNDYLYIYVYALNELHQISANYIFSSTLVFLIYTAISFSLLVIISKNPIYALLSLITVFFSIIVILIILNVEFLSLIFLIIYVGAIAILFLFVIMMFNLKNLQTQENSEGFWYNLIIYLLLTPKIYFVIAYNVNKFLILSGQMVVHEGHNALFYVLNYKTNDILTFSFLLYNYYACLFILTGIILFSSMLGSIVLALSTLEKN